MWQTKIDAMIVTRRKMGPDDRKPYLYKQGQGSQTLYSRGNDWPLKGFEQVNIMNKCEL